MNASGTENWRVEAVGLARGQHAHHGVGLTVHLDRLADDVAVGAEMFPEPVHKNDLVIFAGHSFFRQKIASHQKLVAGHAEKSRRIRVAVDLLRLRRRGEVVAHAAPGAHVRKRLVLLLPVEKIARRHGIVATLNFRPHHHQLIGLGIWHGSQQHGVNHAEDGGVRADAQRKRDGSDQGEAGIFPQQSNTVASILCECFHRSPHSYRSATMGSTFAARRAGM